MASKATLWRKLLPPIVMFALIITVWELLVRFNIVHSWLIPSPFGVVEEMINNRANLMQHWFATLELTMLGYGGGVMAGILIATLLHFIPLLRQALYPVLVLSQNIPLIVIAPIITMLLGFGLMPKVLLIMLVCFFPICIALMAGLAQSDLHLKNYMQMIGSNSWQQFIHLELPGAITHLFSGLKIAASYSVLSAIVAEWLSPKVGLGSYMILSSRSYMPKRVFAAVVMIVFTSLLLFWLVSLLEKMIIRWQPRKEGQ